MKTIVVNRDKWLRGTGDGRLQNEAGQMCCLGFLAKQCGVRNIKNIWSPHDLPPKQAAKCLFTAKLKVPVCSAVGDVALNWKGFVSVNDRIGTPDSMRETKLQALAKQFGFRFKFIGGDDA